MSELLTHLQNNEPQFRKARLAALYSDFRHLQTTNPDGYTANLTAWRTGLSSAAKAGVLPDGSHFSISFSEDLLRSLETKEWGRPLSLGTVVREVVAGGKGGEGKWWMEKEFEEREESVYHKGWGLMPRIQVPGPGDVVRWGLRQLGWGGNEDKLVNGRVVVLENLEEAGREVQRRFEGVRGRVERTLSREEFKEKVDDVLGKEKRLSGKDMELLLRFLARDKQVLAYDEETVKVKAPNEKIATSIGQEDTTVASLKTLIKDLEIQTAVLSNRVDELGVTAKEAVARKNRVSALAALRSKKLAETTLTKRHATLGQLEEVFAKIEQAADQVELIKVMEGSTRVLTGLNQEVGGVERVDDVVDQLREQMGQVDEVGNVIAEVGQAGIVDEGEVDDELEAMEREEKDKVEAKERAEREEREKQEAAETKKRLDALEEVEREAKKKAEEAKEAEKELDKSTEELKRMSLDPENVAA
ncbi:related to protein SNF7 [Phialocephala subalpina]|uniref:Related to protein SNF7 n=1 Tax=Phialocephala subalpina TaxID=576137 RepID=A0A1L7XE52_9HELO|nr:related to protein SNF7 [Phialocephala subalpina]